MTKYLNITLAALLCTLVFSCKQNTSKEVVIAGQIGGATDGTIIHLAELNSDKPFMKDTIMNEKFEFVFQDTLVDKVRELEIIVYDGKPIVNSTIIWVKAPVKIDIKVDAKYPYVWTRGSDVAEQQEANKYSQQTDSLSMEVSLILEQMNSTASAFSGDNMRQQDSLENVFFKLQASVSELLRKREQARFNLFVQEPTYSKFWYSEFLRQSQYADEQGDSYPDVNREKLIAIYNNLTDEQKKNEKIEGIEFLLFPPKTIEIGDKFMDAAMQDVEGKVHHLADYSGKYRLLDFWATWCGPCVAASPELKEIAKKYKDKLIVITINSEEKDVWTKYSQENEMAGVNLHNSSKVEELNHFYKVKGIPHYVLIAPDDHVIDIWSGYGKGSLHDKMKEHLK